MPLQIEQLEKSFEDITPFIDEFIASVYENLFNDYPSMKPIFEHTDMHKPIGMLKLGLAMIIENLRNPGALREALAGLGARHIQYGARPEDYPLLGSSLLKTFEQYLQEDWSPELKTAWMEAYDAITALMLEGADYSPQDVQLNHPPQK